MTNMNLNLEHAGPLGVFCNDEATKAQLVSLLEGRFSEQGWRDLLKEDCRKLSEAPDLMEFRLKTAGMKQAAKLNRKLASPLPSPLVLLDGVILEEAATILREQKFADVSILLTCGFGVVLWKGTEEEALSAHLPTGQGSIVADLWPLLETESCYCLALAGTRIATPSPGVLSHSIIRADDCISATTLLASVTERVRDRIDDGKLIADGTIDAVNRVAILKDEDAWTILSSAVSAMDANLNSHRELKATSSFILTLQGRGRSLGWFKPNQMLRLGISRWR